MRSGQQSATTGAAEPDPRPPVVTTNDDRVRVSGSRCASCGYPVFGTIERCPICRSTSAPAQFGPGGTVFAATVLRVPVPGRTPPFALAYVDLDDGPRILSHVDTTDRPLRPRERVRLIGTTPEGDPLVSPEAAR